VPLVVTAEELALRRVDAGEQQQVPVARLHVDDLELDCLGTATEADVERAPEDVDPRHSLPRPIRDLQVCADLLEPALENLAGHGSLLSREGETGLAAPSSSCRARRSSALTSSVSFEVFLRTMLSKPLAYPSTLDHSTTGCAAPMRSLSCVEELWSPMPHASAEKAQAKAQLYLQALFSSANAEGLSLSGGASIRSRASQAEHHLSFVDG
jgi:hypothetical protein